NGRVKASTADASCLYLGLDNGNLLSLKNQELDELTSFDYPIQSLSMSGTTIVVGTWFYVYGFDIESKAIIWQIEHKGMIEGLQVDDSGRMAFFGEDQNDWTGAEPVGICDLNQERIEVDSSFLQGWFEEEMIEVETNPEIVYRNVDDFTNLLSDEEQESYKQDMQNLEIGLDSLTAAMNEEVSSDSIDEDDDDLDDLLQFLHEDADEIILPKAYAGENQSIRLHDAEAAVITLDGTQSSDPQDRIKTWSWLDGRGREISTEPKLMVKLSAGNHQFELRVFDSEGGMTSDSIQITIQASDS
ncbi:MAG: PKD domain-containing protein, partial [Candidatus Poseidoniaceae archaeon]